MSATTKSDEPVQEQNVLPSVTPAPVSPGLANNRQSLSPSSGKSRQHPASPPSRSNSRTSSRRSTHKSSGKGREADEATWGSNFWVTLVDPQVCIQSWCLEEILTEGVDANIILCLSINRGSKLGTPRWSLRVMSPFLREFLKLILGTGYRQVLKASGGSLATSPVVAYPIIIRLRRGILFGSALKGL